MTDQDYHDMVSREAFAIYQARLRYELPGTPDGDWKNAEDNISTRNKSDILNISVYNRLEKYGFDTHDR